MAIDSLTMFILSVSDIALASMIKNLSDFEPSTLNEEKEIGRKIIIETENNN